MAKELPVWKEKAKDRFMSIYNKLISDTNKTQYKVAEETGISYSTIRDTVSGDNFNADFVIAFLG